jgi:uncharacterized metal-binding protein YceD (DUF177 family)
VSAGTIPSDGKHFRLHADAEARRRLAETLGIPEVASLTAELELRPLRRNAFSLRGTVRAEVVQTDIVTLDPVTQNVAEEIDLTLLSAGEGETSIHAQGAPHDAEAAADTDIYRDGRIDLGAIVAEHLALGLDPYPRAEGVAFEGHVEDDPAADPSPFAALAALKSGKD